MAPSYSATLVSFYSALDTYDVNSNLTSAVQSGIVADRDQPRTRQFYYDGLSRLTISTNPETGTICYGTVPGGSIPTPSNCSSNGYDANGNLLYKTDARGITTSYAYDALNRLSTKNFSDGSWTEGFGYDGYDASGNRLPQNYLATSNVIGRMTYASHYSFTDRSFAYDSMGRLTTQTYCLPDNCGNRQTVTAQYDLAGHMTNLTYPDGRQVAQLWDPAGRLSSVNSVTAITGGPIFNGPAGVNVALSPYWTANSYFPDGSLNSVAYGNGANELRWENSRSQTCELSMFMPPAVGGTQMFDHQYFFGQAGGGTACAPTAGNNGNISQIVDNTNPTAGSNTRNQTFGYDSLNRLTSWSTASMSGSPRGQAYSYDSFGNISQTNGVNMPNVSPGYDANNHMQGLSCGSNIYDLAGNVLCQGMWGIDAQSYSYDAESRVWQVQAQSMGTQFNIVARARYYASNMGRWVSPDWASNPQAIPYASYADPQSLNLYNYMRNNPLGGVDADGHLPDWLKDLGIGFAKGFGKAVSPLGNGLNYLHNISHPSSGQLPTNMGYSYDNSTQAIGGAFSTGLMVVAGEALSMPGYGGSTTVTASAPAALATESVPTTALLEGLANDAVQNVGPGSGAAYGTVVHSEFSDLVEALGNPNLFTEQSYLNGQPVSYGTPGSIRIDVGEGTINAPTGVYDLKTGSATLTPKRVEQIQSHLPNGSNVPVTEIRPPQ